jgi:hypothetical protein
LLEVSLTEHPADKGAIARAISPEVRRVRRRMQARQESIFDRDGADRGVRMPDRRLVRYGAPDGRIL